MEVDHSFLDPIKEFHPILRVVEMPARELAALLPLRINRFCFVTQPFAEAFGFPIDAPKVRGVDLIELHVLLTEQLTKVGASNVVLTSPLELGVKNPRYNSFIPHTADDLTVRWTLRGENGRVPLVMYQGKLRSLASVESHINALAIYCNTLFNDPQNCKSKLLAHLPEGYSLTNTGMLISRGVIHGRWDYLSALDLLYSCILNYMRL